VRDGVGAKKKERQAEESSSAKASTVGSIERGASKDCSASRLSSSSSHLLVSLAGCAGVRGSTCAVVVRTFWATRVFFFFGARVSFRSHVQLLSYVSLYHRAFVFVLTHVSLLAPAKTKQCEEPVAKRSDNAKGKSEEEEHERRLLEGPSVIPTAEDEINSSSSEMGTIKKMLTQCQRLTRWKRRSTRDCPISR
jgi:hypothetical protein